jgi:membrane-associated phospholipid phosphatase
VVISLFLAAALSVPQRTVDSSFWRGSDSRLVIATVVATGALAVFDERIASWTRRSGVQGSSDRHDLVSAVTEVNEWPLTIIAVTTYGVGKLGRWPVVADVGAHLTQTLVATGIVAEVVRIGLGRTRPHASPDDAFRFEPGGGFTAFDYRSFPSIHAAVAFATAASLAEEMRMREYGPRRILAPLLFAAATIPGFTRLYLDQHWASDVLVGSVVGAFLGTRVVRYTHGRRTKVDRILLDAKVGIYGHGGMVGVKLVH